MRSDHQKIVRGTKRLILHEPLISIMWSKACMRLIQWVVLSRGLMISNPVHMLKNWLSIWESRLDSRWPQIHPSILFGHTSDHAMLKFELTQVKQGIKPFFYYSSWLHMHSFNDLFRESWEVQVIDAPLYNLHYKLRFTKWSFTPISFTFHQVVMLETKTVIDNSKWDKKLSTILSLLIYELKK